MRKETIERYIYTIYRLQTLKELVRGTDIANALKVNHATVTETLKKLKNSGFVKYSPYQIIFLTAKGEEVGKSVEDRFHVLKKLLLKAGVDNHTAFFEAQNLKYFVSEKNLENLRSPLAK